jgi:uridine phosphorylase
MNKDIIPDSELVLNRDRSVYHLKLKEEHIADTILLVGDMGRVKQVSQLFDKIEFQNQNREFVTHTGIYKGKRISVLSTGIGPDNIDIVMNELDAVVNIDLEKRQHRPVRKSLNLVRIGTSGGLQKDVPVGSFVVSEYGLGLDGLIYYYDYPYDEAEKDLARKINEHLQWNTKLSEPYITKGSRPLIEKIGYDMVKGITVTATGFYGPQGRSLYLNLNDSTMNERLQSFSHNDHRVINFDMETSALYGLGRLLGHNCCTCNAIIANRTRKEFYENYPELVDRLIKSVLDRLTD